MTRNRKWFCLPLIAALAAFVTPPALLAGGTGENKPDKLDMIQDQLKKLAASADKKFDTLLMQLAESFDKIQKDAFKFQKEIKSLKEEKIIQDAKLKKLEDAMATLEEVFGKMQADVLDLKIKMNGIKSSSFEKGELLEIKSKLEQIEKTLAQLKSGTPSISKSSPVGGTCKVVLINNTTEEITVLLNKNSYRVAAGATLNVEAVPAGVMSYEVLYPGFGSIRRNTTTLNPSEVFNIKVG